MAQIDASIPLQVKPFQAPNLLAQYADIQQIQDGQQRNRLYDMQISAAERDAAAKQATGDAFRTNVGIDGTINRQGLVGSLAQSGQGAAIPGIQKTFSEQDTASRAAEKAGLELALQKQGAIAQLAGSATDQPSWDKALQLAKSMGADISQAPPQYSPEAQQQIVQASLTGVQQLEQHWKAKQFDLDEQKFGYQQGNDAANRGVTMRGQDLSANTAIRGQNMVDARSREANSAGGKGQIVQGPDGPVLVDPRTGLATAVTNADGSSLQAPKAAAEATARTRDATDVLALLDQAEPLIGASTSSYGGAAVDALARVGGISTDGANAAAQLRALEGALISKMPKMSGPQSDKDVLLYKQMAGQIGDATVPAAQKRAAMATIRQINERQIGTQGRPAPQSPRVSAGAIGAAQAPAPGTVQEGYRFRGGNPADQASWEKL